MLDNRDIATNYPVLDKYTSNIKKPNRAIVGREKEMRSLWASMMRPELCNVILLGDAGAGKAHSNDTLIPVNDCRGYVRIEDLKVGDEVFDENGTPTKVLGVYPQGRKRAYEVTLSDKTRVICNNEHLWAARTRKQHHTNKPYQIVTLQDMMDYGIVCRNSSSGDLKNWYIPMPRPVQRDSIQLPIHPYVIGVLIGDGCLTGDVKQLCVSSADEAVVKRVASLIGAKDYEFTQSDNYNWLFLRDDEKINNSGKPMKYIQQYELADLVDFDCVFYTKSINKRIPRQYMLGSVEQRFELLRGLMDTDGTITGNDRVNCSLSTSSEGLAEDFVELVTSLGMRATISVQNRYDDNHKNPEYKVHISCEDDKKSQLFWLDKHKQKFKQWCREEKRFYKHYDDIAIASVCDLGYETEMTCIYVDSPSHLYQCTEHHIVTHNTMLVQGTMMKDTSRIYLEVSLSHMISDNGNDALPGMLETLFSEVVQFRQAENKEIVLFIDEFHRIIQSSPAAIEALKPLLADSGTRGIKVIAATTFKEFEQYISPNQPLVERLQRINVNQPNKEMTIEILKGMAKTYGVDNQFYNDYIYEMIYEYTNRYIPANSQPRKSILVLDSMVGWHRAEGRRLDLKLLADVIYEQEGINVAFRVDATKIKKTLDENVLSQQFASSVIEQRLQICVADLNNKSKPMSSFLFTGSTGVGKEIDDNELIPIYTSDGSVHHKRNGDLEVGDFVFNRKGQPVEVLGVFPQGVKDVYEVEFVDGRKLRVGAKHLWMYKSCYGNGAKDWKVTDTETLMKKCDKKYYSQGRSVHNIKFVIPMNEAVQYPIHKFKTDPYVIGVGLGNGCFRESAFSISSSDVNIIKDCQKLIGAVDYYKDPSAYTYSFYTGELRGTTVRCKYQTSDILSEVPELIGMKSGQKMIPDLYKYASVEQRWALVQGMFDTDGTISNNDRFNVSYSTTSKQLAYDLQDLLYSLGISSSVNPHDRVGKSTEYDVHVKCNAEDKVKFFRLERKRKIAEDAVKFVKNKKRVKKFGEVLGIRDIRKLDEKTSMTCIMVNDDEHLYQAGQYCVTHNTEMTKQLANILFEDDRRLIRFDMTEYANPDSLERFRNELTAKVWEKPYSIVLLDEIEKACAEVTRVLLQVLDDGRLMDANNREVVFTNCYIILTTNAGSEIYKNIAQYNADDTGSGVQMKKYDKLIRRSISSTSGSNRFPPELLGRIDTIVPFQPLSEETQKKIVEMKLKKLKDEVMQKHNVELKIQKNVIRYLVEDNLDTDSNAGGARIIMSKLESEVTTAIARFINSHPNVYSIGVVVEGDMAADNKQQLESSAYIKIIPAGQSQRKER